MIVARGMGRGGAGALVAFGLGNSRDYVPPPVSAPSAGGGTSSRLRRRPAALPDGLLAQALAEDEIILTVVTAVVAKGMLGWPGR